MKKLKYYIILLSVKYFEISRCCFGHGRVELFLDKLEPIFLYKLTSEYLQRTKYTKNVEISSLYLNQRISVTYE